MNDAAARNDQSSGTVRNIALTGSYVPRKCGIATFTKDLRDALVATGEIDKTLVIAMDDTPSGYPYPPEVAFQVQAYKGKDYLTAADLLNINQVDLAIVQHEYGIYGGPDGDYILDLVTRLRMPVIATLHTVLREPTKGQAKVMRELAKRCDRLVVMSHLAKQILADVYGVQQDKIVYIPHGIPDVPFVDPAFYKDQFGLEGRTVMLTFGLLSPGKGIEVAIKALPEIVKEHPEVVYVILGATHPHVLKQDGNAYRHSLERLARQLGVEEHVVFHNRFVTLDELCGYIGAADIYLTPYLNEAQITSGTLAYAMGAGKATVSTPFWYAVEMIGADRGRLFPFGDSEALAAAVNELLASDIDRNAIRKRAYAQGRSMTWPEVGLQYLDLARQIVQDHRRKPRPPFTVRRPRWDPDTVPDVDLRHLFALTDSTGMFQHAVYNIPDRFHGYCTDDNARALIVALMCHDLYQDSSVLPLINTYLSFVHHAFDPELKRFRNFMSYDRRWLEEKGSTDSHGRAIWALGAATALAPNDSILTFAARLFNDGLAPLEQFSSPRTLAFALIGIHAYLRRFDGDTHARRLRAVLAQRLHQQFKNHASPEWPWCEDILAYDNAKLPHVLILSGQWIPDPEMIEDGLRALEWLIGLHVSKNNKVRLIGNCGWMRRNGERAHFDQQPIDACALVEACGEAYRCTQEPVWLERARTCFSWFLGNNDSEAVLFDYQTGGCRDGLSPSGPNQNQGAESTVAWLLALLTMHDLTRPARIGADAGQKISDTAPSAEKALLQ